MNFEESKQFYRSHYSLGFLNTNIRQKFALISLVCEVTKLAKQKSPGVTHYQILRKISDSLPMGTLPDDFIEGLAVVCEDFAYGCEDFLTFELKPSNYVPTIKSILETYVPF